MFKKYEIKMLGCLEMINSLSTLFKKKNMFIIISLLEIRVDLAKAALEEVADVLKFHINVIHRASGNVFNDIDYYKDFFLEIRELYEGPLGLVLTDDVNKVNDVDIEKVKKCGFTYYSLYAKDITSKLLLQSDLEKSVAVDNLFKPHNVKLVENFGMAAVELSIAKKKNYGTPLHFEDIVA